MNRVLLVGGGGYVGAELQPFLASLGYAVRVYDTFWYSRGMWPKDSFLGREHVEYIDGDVRDIAKLKTALKDVDYCIHLACVSNDPSYELDPTFARNINYNAFQALIPILNSSELKRFIFASSSSVYGIKEEPNVTEELSLEPLTDYSKYKVRCEELVQEQIKPEITHTILRPSTVCGYSRRQRFDLVVNILTLSALQDGLIRVDGGGQYRPNLHIKDMLRSYARVLEADPELVRGKIFNVAGQNLKVRDLALMVRNIVGQHVNIEYVPTIDARSYRVSGELIAKTLGFTPEYSVQDAILDLVSAFRAGKFGDTDWNEYYNLRRMKELLSS